MAGRSGGGTLVGPGICRKCRPLGGEFRRIFQGPPPILYFVVVQGGRNDDIFRDLAPSRPQAWPRRLACSARRCVGPGLAQRPDRLPQPIPGRPIRPANPFRDRKMAKGRGRGRREDRLSSLQETLRRTIKGEVLFDAATRGRYSTDASIYQIEPVGVVVPRDETDLALIVDVARDAKAAILPRGAGTSQSGQTAGETLVIDVSKYLREIVGFNKDRAEVTVQPGVVLDQLNAWLKPQGLWYPVDVSTSAQCTLGGMAGNNSCGSRSIRYGNMVHNVASIDAILADGQRARFGSAPPEGMPAAIRDIADKVAAP